jgi:hypothetical protein
MTTLRTALAGWMVRFRIRQLRKAAELRTKRLALARTCGTRHDVRRHEEGLADYEARIADLDRDDRTDAQDRAQQPTPR